jgi:hypothetical protein
MLSPFGTLDIRLSCSYVIICYVLKYVVRFLSSIFIGNLNTLSVEDRNEWYVYVLPKYMISGANTAKNTIVGLTKAFPPFMQS